jgi:hypothetical protein
LEESSFLFIFCLLVLREENMKLKAKNKVLEQRLEMVNKELLDLQALNQSIIAINEEFGRENDELYKKVGQYETLQKPRNMQKHHTHKKHHRRSDSENSEDETPPRKKVIFRVDSDSISSEDDDGAKKNETSARVCNIIFRNDFISIFDEFYLYG